MSWRSPGGWQARIAARNGVFAAATTVSKPLDEQDQKVVRAAAIAVLMNTRGLTELVILLIGKQVGVLDTAMFTMMVVMALVTTVMTEPLLRIVYPDKAVQRDIVAALRQTLPLLARHASSRPVEAVLADRPPAPA